MISKRIKYFVGFIILAIFSGLQGCAQDSGYKSIVLKIEGGTFDFFNQELGMSGVTVEIIQNDKVIYSEITEKGNYNIIHKMDISIPFFLQYSKESYLTKRVLINFEEDSLKKLAPWSDTVVPFSNLDMTMIHKEPYLKNIASPITVVEFFMSNKYPAMKFEKAKENRKAIYDELKKYSGEQKDYYPNGDPKASLNIKDGQLEGECCWWDESGAILKKGQFLMGKLQE